MKEKKYAYRPNRLKELLERDYGGNKMELRRAAGSNNETVTRFIEGCPPNVAKLVDICNYFGYSLLEFFTADGVVMSEAYGLMPRESGGAVAGVKDGTEADGEAVPHRTETAAGTVAVLEDAERVRLTMQATHAAELADLRVRLITEAKDMQIAELRSTIAELRADIEERDGRLMEASRTIGQMQGARQGYGAPMANEDDAKPIFPYKRKGATQRKSSAEKP